MIELNLQKRKKIAKEKKGSNKRVPKNRSVELQKYYSFTFAKMSNGDDISLFALKKV